MTKQQIITHLSDKRIKPFETIRAGTIEVYRGYEVHGNFSVMHGNHQIGGGRIPASADPEVYPLKVAIASVNEMEFQ